MKVKLTDGSEAIINMRHLIYAVLNKDGTATVMLDGFYSTWGQYTNEAYYHNNEYTIDSESYQRIVEYIDKMEGKI